VTVDGRDEIIIVRSLTDSDMGLFAAHRKSATSKQRAININAPAAHLLLSKELIESGGGELECICKYGCKVIHGPRWLGKTGRNWRLGGVKIEGDEFASLDSKDFLLIRSVAGNDGNSPVLISFISKKDERVIHAGIAAIVEKLLNRSMAIIENTDPDFKDISAYCPPPKELTSASFLFTGKPSSVIPTMPEDVSPAAEMKKPTLKARMRSPHILERMLASSADLSAPAQLHFMETVELLATQLREVLLKTGRIHKLYKNHNQLWARVKGEPIGFVDGGLANLSMVGSAPIAARVGGYVVTPGDTSDERECFSTLKLLIDELYSQNGNGVYTESFPDISALRDAARISIEAAGAVRMLIDHKDIRWIFLHGALVNPVSRYTDIMKDRQVVHPFPGFNDAALVELLGSKKLPDADRDKNFISVHLKQLKALAGSAAVICGVVERESTTTSICRAVLNSLNDDEIRDLLPRPPDEWKIWFRTAVDPSGNDEFEGQRISDSLLFRFVLEPGEYLSPVCIERNEMRRAPEAWKDIICQYPKPFVSYLLPSEWNAPIRVEVFEKDLKIFHDTAELVYHCALLLPKYSFPAGLDIVDKFAKIPDWMSRPVNTNTAVQAMKRALDSKDMALFNSVRRMLCGSSREWLLRPGIFR
jgi:hypothetical protein